MLLVMLVLLVVVSLRSLEMGRHGIKEKNKSKKKEE